MFFYITLGGVLYLVFGFVWGMVKAVRNDDPDEDPALVILGFTLGGGLLFVGMIFPGSLVWFLNRCEDGWR